MVGILLRTISIKWQSALFEEVCDIFEHFSAFMSCPSIAQESEAAHTAVGTQRLFHVEAESYLQLAERASKLQDLVPAMEHLHQFYDLSGQDACLFSDQVAAGGPNPARRHQQAMLTMAAVWMRSGTAASHAIHALPPERACVRVCDVCAGGWWLRGACVYVYCV